MTRLCMITALAAVCLAQDAPTFEAASIKPMPIVPGGGSVKWLRGGPGTDDPTRIDYQGVSLIDLICKAYAVEYYQIVGPNWLRVERYYIAATVAPGSTEKQLQVMLRNLLSERFKVRLHRDLKEIESYVLTVAKGGPKLKTHLDSPPDDKPQSFGSKTDSDGYPVIPREGLAAINGRARMKFPDTGVDRIANLLSLQLGSPVIDHTGLTGKYDFDLFWSTQAPDADVSGPDLVSAVRQQLGLNIERRKAPVEVLVVDQAEKTPTAN